LRNFLTVGLSVFLWTGAQADKDRIHELGIQAASLRGLSYRPVASQVVSQKECVEYLLRLLDQEMKPSITQKREGFLKLLGLMPEKGSMKKIYAELYTDQVRGLYDPHRQRYLVVRSEGKKGSEDLMEGLTASMGLNLESILTIHELGHAIQDQHFQLGAISKKVAANFDEELAASSLIEGDASALMMDYALRSVGMDSEGLEVGAMGGLDQEQMMLGSSPALSRAPRFFREVLGFPYNQGMAFVGSLRRGKDWSAVNRAFRTLPESSEQILHPEKYGRDHPKEVQVQAGAMAGANSLGQDTAGEFTIRCWARENGGEEQAAAGWGGDRYEIFRTARGLSGCWATTWDSEKDAREFEKLALHALTGKGKQPAQIERQGLRVTVLLNYPPKWQ
jgi:hypothetical protein